MAERNGASSVLQCGLQVGGPGSAEAGGKRACQERGVLELLGVCKGFQKGREEEGFTSQAPSVGRGCWGPAEIYGSPGGSRLWGRGRGWGIAKGVQGARVDVTKAPLGFWH